MMFCSLLPPSRRAPFAAISLLSGAACAASLGLASALPKASACTLVPIAAYVVAERVPLSGPILLDVRCEGTDYCATATPGLVVRDGAAAVAGELRLLRGDEHNLYLSFFPAAPLRDGATYALESQLPEGSEGAALSVVAAADATFPATDLANASATLSNGKAATGEAICCAGGASCFGTCFHENEVRVANLQAALDDANATGEVDPAYVYRLRFRDGELERETPWTRASEPPVAEFARPSSRFCANLERRSLIDGQTTQRELCRDAEPGVTYGEVTPAAWDDFMFTSGDCPAPPGVDPECDPFLAKCSAPSDKLRRAWCAAQMADCMMQASVSLGCITVSAYCDDGNMQTDAGTVGGASDGGVAVVPSDGGQSVDAGARAKKDDDGCSAMSGTARTSGAGWLLATLAALALRRRRARTP